MDNKWRTCKLTTDEYGKVRWCFGSSKTWSNKLKILIFLPLILLTIISLHLLTNYIRNATAINNASNHTIINENDAKIANQAGLYEAFIEGNVSFGSSFIKRIYEGLSNKTMGIWNRELDPEDVRKIQGENMVKYMNTSVDPCDDFYEYTCGKWSQHHPNPTHQSRFNTFELVRENVDHYLKELLEQTADNDNNNTTNHNLQDVLRRAEDKSSEYELYVPKVPKQKPTYFEKILMVGEDTVEIDPILKTRQMYKSCMDQETIERRGIQPLLDLLRELRYWPIIQREWNESNFDLIWLLAQLRLYNNDILIGEWVAPDMNSGKYVVMLKQPPLGLPKKDYFLEAESKTYIQSYQNFMWEIVSILGANPDVAKKDVEDIISFEIELAKIIPTNDCQNYTAKSHAPRSLWELQEIIPQIDWIKYFHIILEANMKEPPLNMTIVTYCVDYLKDLAILIEETPERTLTNYILWRFVTNRIDNLDGRFNGAKQKFHDVLHGGETLPPRWRVCVGQTNSHLSFALGHLFVKKYFDENSKNDTVIMVKTLQTAYNDIITSSLWLGDKSKEMAVEKIDSIQLKIGYPDQILDAEMLAVQYHDVLINPNYYFENCLSLLQHTFRKGHWKLGKKVNMNVWDTAPTVVNAYYIVHKNQISMQPPLACLHCTLGCLSNRRLFLGFPAAILEPPFYHRYFPRAINYGGIGVTIGHEISHAFDDKGRYFDNEGKISLWLSKNDTEKLNRISNCLTDQYNRFALPDLNINLDGLVTLSENIADNSAIKPAYNAYMKWLENNEDLELPYVNVSSIQLFFISYAQVLCGNTKQEAIKRRAKASAHPPGKFRVLGTLRNFPEFSKAFHCEEGSLMNPKNKCTIW